MNPFEQRQRTGKFGEAIIDNFLRQKGWVPYYPVAEQPHPFDRLVASPDKRSLCIVEIKTKHRREAYKDTGIDLRHFNDYQQVTMRYGIPLFLAFVDSKVGKVYGNWWHELIKSREPDLNSKAGGCQSYPWEHRGIVYFPLEAMRYLYVLNDQERQELMRMRVSNWKECIEHEEEVQT